MKKAIPILLAVLLAACNSKTPETPVEKPVADPSASAKGYCDGTDTKGFLELNKACKAELKAGRQDGPNCVGYKKASDEADSIARQQGKACVGVRIRF